MSTALDIEHAMRPTISSAKPGHLSRRLSGTLLALLLGLASLEAAAKSPLEAVTAEMPPIKTIAFTVSPPKGENWFYYHRALPGYVTFRKQDPIKKVMPGGEHLSFVIEIKAENFPNHDLTTSTGLEEALKFTLYESPGDAYQYGTLRIESFIWQETDCVSYAMSREQPEMLDGERVVFFWAVEGFFCRHPADPKVAVTGLFQERRLANTPSRLDDVLREEAQQSLQSVRFVEFK